MPEWAVRPIKEPFSPAHPRRIRLMWERHGACEGNKCAGCAMLHLFRDEPMHYECAAYTWGSKREWRIGWGACGLFQELSRPLISAFKKGE